MPKRILVTENGLFQMLKSFFKAKKANKEAEWLTALKKKNANLAKHWKELDLATFRQLLRSRQVIQALGASTNDIDSRIKKLGYPLPSEEEIEKILNDRSISL